MGFLVNQGVALAILFVLTQIVEKKANMRGQHYAATYEKILRCIFLLVLVGPLSYMLDTEVLPYPFMSPLVLLYMIPYTDLSEQRGGRRPIARSWGIWTRVKNYFGLTLVKTVDLDPKKRYLFGIHPHGILPFGGVLGMGLDSPGGFGDLFPGIEFRVLAATFTFYLPIYRDLLLAAGFADAAKRTARQVLEKYSLLLVPGGATEALYSSPHKDVVYLRKRLGFIRLAIELGTPLVPVFSFNENNTFDQMNIDRPWVKWAKHKFQRIFGLSLPLISNIIPKRCNITVVVGKPLEVPQIDKPSNEVVQEWLDKYIICLQELYNSNREKYNVPPTKPDLEIL